MAGHGSPSAGHDLLLLLPFTLCAAIVGGDALRANGSRFWRTSIENCLQDVIKTNKRICWQLSPNLWIAAGCKSHLTSISKRRVLKIHQHPCILIRQVPTPSVVRFFFFFSLSLSLFFRDLSRLPDVGRGMGGRGPKRLHARKMELSGSSSAVVIRLVYFTI